MISGLLTQKPGRDPQVGEIKCYRIESRVSVNGNPWNKVINTTPDKGGLGYRIVGVRTARSTPDPYGNVSFNVDLEPAELNQAAFRQSQDTSYNAPQWSGNAPLARFMSKDDYWERKEQRDREWQAEQVRNKPRIERQHSQEMAIRYCAMMGGLPKGKEEWSDTYRLLLLIDWFQRDIDRAPGQPEPPQPEQVQRDEDEEIPF